MLGAAANPSTTRPTVAAASSREEHGRRAPRYRTSPVGVYFGEPGKTVPTRTSGARGRSARGCIAAAVHVRLPHGAKNTLAKNYLYLAERRGARILPDRTVVDIRPLDAEDGSDGYAVTSVASGTRFCPSHQCGSVSELPWSCVVGTLHQLGHDDPDAQEFLEVAPWLAIFPGLALAGDRRLYPSG